MKKLVFMVLSVSALSFAGADTVATEMYGYLPGTSIVAIDLKLAGKINSLIKQADANFLVNGRDASELENPDMAENTIRKAMNWGGFSAGKTYFRDFFADDMVSMSIETAYEKGSLKMIKKFKRQSKYTTGTSKYKKTIVQDEIVWLYQAKIKVDYRISVDSEMIEGTYYQTSKIITPVRLKGVKKPCQICE